MQPYMWRVNAKHGIDRRSWYGQQGVDLAKLLGIALSSSGPSY
jgi:hypothetical protein